MATLHSEDYLNLLKKGISGAIDGNGTSGEGAPPANTKATAAYPEQQQPAGIGATQAANNVRLLHSGLGFAPNVALLSLAGVLSIVLLIRLTK